MEMPLFSLCFVTDFAYIPFWGFVLFLFLFCILKVFGIGLFFEMCNSFMEFLKRIFILFF